MHWWFLSTAVAGWLYNLIATVYNNVNWTVVGIYFLAFFVDRYLEARGSERLRTHLVTIVELLSPNFFTWTPFAVLMMILLFTYFCWPTEEPEHSAQAPPDDSKNTKSSQNWFGASTTQVKQWFESACGLAVKFLLVWFVGAIAAPLAVPMEDHLLAKAGCVDWPVSSGTANYHTFADPKSYGILPAHSLSQQRVELRNGVGVPSRSWSEKKPICKVTAWSADVAQYPLDVVLTLKLMEQLRRKEVLKFCDLDTMIGKLYPNGMLDRPPNETDVIRRTSCFRHDWIPHSQSLPESALATLTSEDRQMSAHLDLMRNDLGAAILTLHRTHFERVWQPVINELQHLSTILSRLPESDAYWYWVRAHAFELHPNVPRSSQLQVWLLFRKTMYALFHTQWSWYLHWMRPSLPEDARRTTDRLMTAFATACKDLEIYLERSIAAQATFDEHLRRYNQRFVGSGKTWSGTRVILEANPHSTLVHRLQTLPDWEIQAIEYQSSVQQLQKHNQDTVASALRNQVIELRNFQPYMYDMWQYEGRWIRRLSEDEQNDFRTTLDKLYSILTLDYTPAK